MEKAEKLKGKRVEFNISARAIKDKETIRKCLDNSLQNYVKYDKMLISAKAVAGKGLEKGWKMITEPVYLEDISSVVTLEEVPQKILVQNPGERELVITQEESGWNKEQVFTSECLPDVIPYELLGVVKFPDGSAYPKYRANVVTETRLGLKGQFGYENGINIINKVAWWLTWQEKVLEAKSIKKSDLEVFDYEKEKLSYWLDASTSYHYGRYLGFGPGAVDNGNISNCSGDLIDSFGQCNADELSIRPTMILKAKLKVNSNDNVNWISF